MSEPGLTFARLDGPQAAAHADELRALHAEVYADPPYGRAESALRAWGWRKIARTRPEPGSPTCDVLVIALPA